LLSAEQRADGFRFKFNIAAVLRGDTKSQLESLATGVSNGIYTPNEARRNLDLPSKSGGDRIYFNGSNVAVEDAGVQYDQTPEPPPENPDTKALLYLAKTIESAIMELKGKDNYIQNPETGLMEGSTGGGSGGSGSVEPSQENTTESGISGKHEYSNSQNSVDLDYLKSEEYKNKFKGITGNTKIDEQLYKQSKAMLTHRNGTDKEDMCLIDSRTGKIAGHQSNSKVNFGVEYNNSINNAIRDNPPYSLISIHNHPTNNPPTGSDLVSNGANRYKLGVVVTHNGKVFTYRAGKIPFSASNFGKQVDKYRGSNYNEYDAIIKTLSDYTVQYGIEWSER
ncbi:MAG: phage portal protein, partial [Clostridia bacterium]|nr:phage portal protein [Clostridia bacterium]